MPATTRHVTRNGTLRNGHDLKRVDLLGDAHRAELGGEPAADCRREREPGDERRDLPGVEVSRQEAGEGRCADGIERGVSLQAHDGAGEQTETHHHADGAADDGECTGPEGDLPEEADDLLVVAADRMRDREQDAQVEAQLLAQGGQRVDGPLDDRRHFGHVSPLAAERV